MSTPGFLGSRWATVGSWESACSSEDLVPDYRAQAPGFPDIEFVAIPTLDSGGW